jgi:hypothetical protein
MDGVRAVGAQTQKKGSAGVSRSTGASDETSAAARETRALPGSNHANQILLARAGFWFRISAVGTHGVFVIAGVLGLGLCLSGQASNRADSLSLNTSSPGFPSLGLSNAQYFFFATGLNWLEPRAGDFLPALPTASQPGPVAQSDASKDSSKEIVDLSRNKLIDYVHGEVGFLYGRSTGKFDREVEAGYVFGTVGNDKFSITAGGVFEHSSGRLPKVGR